MIALGCDHGGLVLKKAIIEHFDRESIPYKDFGTFTERSVDYAPIAYKVAKSVSDGLYEKGILCCGTGIGISIAANKVKKVRAAVCTNEFMAEMTRKHNDANILCLGGRIINSEKAIDLVKIFLTTDFDGGRHSRRIEQISKIENSEMDI